MNIKQLSSYKINESGFIHMAVTTPPNGEIKLVHIAEHCYIYEEDAIDYIKKIYRDGKVPFILPVKL